MSRITLDADQIQKLMEPREPVEVCDPSGAVIGFFSPMADATHFVDNDPISEEELERRANSNGPRFKPDEVLRRLKSL